MEDEQDFDDIVVYDGDDDIEEEDVELDDDGDDDTDPDEPESADEPEEEEEEPAPKPEKVAAKGSKESPLRVKDLPDNEFVELEIDGVKEVMSKRDLANNVVLGKAAHKRMEEAAEIRKQARAEAEEAHAETQRIRDGLIRTLQKPAELDAFMEHHYPEQWAEAVKLGVKRILALEDMSERDRIAYIRQRDQRLYERQLAKERSELEQIRQERARMKAQEESKALLREPWRRAMADAGNPQLDEESGSRLFKEIGRRLDIETQYKGEQLSQDEVYEIISLSLSKHVGKRPAQPKIRKKPAKSRGPRQRNKGSRFSGDFADWSFDHLRD